MISHVIFVDYDLLCMYVDVGESNQIPTLAR